MDEATRELVTRALAEDLGEGDVTSAATVPEDAPARARIVQKAPGVAFGLEVAGEVLRQAGGTGFEVLVGEGEWNDRVPLDLATAEGPAQAILAGERVALNLLGRLSGVATLTARFVGAVAGTGVRILDTRKTTPGLRALEKAAVAAGGGVNHRMGLYDAILIKENHVAMAGGLAQAVAAARAGGNGLPVEVECRGLGEVEAGIEAGADRILLDNMSAADLTAAVALRDSGSARPELEASGGVTLENVAGVAATGVDFISVGALTHSAPALDVSMLIEPVQLYEQ